MRAGIAAVIAAASCVAAPLVGCGEDENPAPPRRTADADDAGAPALSATGAPSTPLRRLTRTEYINSVRALLGDTFGIAENIPPEPAGNGFDNTGDSFSISEPLVEQYLAIAEQLAAKVDPLALGGCATTDADAACARTLVGKVGPRAYRRPLDPSEVDDLVALYTTARADNDHPSSLRAVLTRMLVSPDFLYHVEVGEAPPPDGTSPNLTPHELASRLSYLLWESMPDDALFDVATSGALRDRAVVATQIDRMLADPRAKDTIWHMHRQWLELDRLDTLVKDATVYPGFDDAKADVLEATHQFVDDVVWNGPGGLDSLLTAPFTFANDRVGALYLPGQAVGASFTKVAQDPAQRVGILGQPAILATFGKADKSSPILRGVFIRDRLLCAPLPPPPPGANNIPADAPAAKTTREFFATLTAPEQCQGCHAQINPVGFGLENFDGIGRYRTTENGTPVDASGSVTSGDVMGPFTGEAELAKKLAQSEAVRACVVRNWFRFAYGRSDSDGDKAVLGAIGDHFKAGGFVLRSLPAELAKAEPFYRLHFTVLPLPGAP